MIIPAYAVLSAGNFWELQQKLENYPGIISTIVGYAGGQLPNPTYQQVAQGISGHLEAVKVTYDTNLLNYEQVLDIFFQTHNPYQRLPMSSLRTQLFNPTIFYLDEIQQQIAIKKQRLLQQKNDQPVLTQIRPLEIFYPAESYHQHFHIKPGQTSCCLTKEC